MQILILSIIGLIAGFFGGMLGIGGSLIMIPAMTELLGPDQHLYQAGAMIVTVFVALPAVYQHRRVGAIDARTVGRLIPVAVPAVVAGVWVSEWSLFAGDGEAYLRALFGVFVLCVVGYELHKTLRRQRSPPLPDLWEPPVDRDGTTSIDSAPKRPGGWRLAAIVAVPTGLIAGLLGVGGGVVAVPLQQRFLGVGIRVAIANSAAVIIATGLVGATVKNYAYMTTHANGLEPVRLAAVLIPMAIVGSLLGSRLTHRLPIRAIKIAFLLMMLFVGIRLTHRAVIDLRQPRASGTVAVSAVLARAPVRSGEERRACIRPAQLSRGSAPMGM